MSALLKLTGVDKFYGAIGKSVHAVQNIDMDEKARLSPFLARLAVAKPRPCGWLQGLRKPAAARSNWRAAKFRRCRRFGAMWRWRLRGIRFIPL